VEQLCGRAFSSRVCCLAATSFKSIDTSQESQRVFFFHKMTPGVQKGRRALTPGLKFGAGAVSGFLARDSNF
jgi:hypothetical protein